MAKDDEGERPRRSWREIDKARGRSRHTSTSSDRERERFEKTTAYTRYKQNLERVFAGGELSDALRERLDPTGKGKEKDVVLKKIREAEDSRSFAAAVDELIARFELPDDPYLLDRILEHPRSEVVLMALANLNALADQGKLEKPPKSLPVRLASLELNAEDDEVQAGARALKARLR
jgi:hypothetical protein